MAMDMPLLDTASPAAATLDRLMARGAAFLDAGKVIEVSPVDGIHFEPEAHVALGRAIAEAVRAL